ncbi:MAG: 16S rRNA (guanine(966)-N(2))-methyltransferase RsmD [Eubacteriales bacterium]
MRVITGVAKGRKLSSPKNDRIRPTTDRIKESLFNIISLRVEGSTFLDCFSGTGSIGIEAMSRGAKTVFFIDNHKESIQIIHKNLMDTGFSRKANVLAMDIQRGFEALSKKSLKFDIIFMDPPYNMDIIPQCIQGILQYHLLSDEGCIIAEHDKNLSLQDEILYCQRKETRFYGSTGITFYGR